MKTQFPPIYRDCRRLLLHTEQVVRHFSRYHKYTIGTDLRQQAMAVMRTVHLAVYDKTNQAQHIHSLVWVVDSYKLTLQLCIELGTFVHSKSRKATPTQESAPGFAAFELAAQLAAAIGKQCGGWHRQASAVAKTTSPKTAQSSHAQDHVLHAQVMAGLKPLPLAQARPASLSEHAASFTREVKP
jgi:hypothetical protein